MLAVLILTGTSLVSCSDNAVLTAIKQEVAGSSAAAKHAYIAGRVGNSTNGQIPVYWKDGVINYLQLSPTYTNGWTCGITVDKSGNVYVQGGQWNTTSTIYGYWKGSIFTQLSTGGYAYLWEQNIAVDTTGNVWLAYDVSNSGTYPPTIPAYWENSGSPTLLPSATNVWDVIADGSGNVYFFGTTGGTSDNAASPDYSQTPAVWKNGTSLTSLAVTAGGATLTGMRVAGRRTLRETSTPSEESGHLITPRPSTGKPLTARGEVQIYLMRALTVATGLGVRTA